MHHSPSSTPPSRPSDRRPAADRTRPSSASQTRPPQLDLPPPPRALAGIAAALGLDPAETAVLWAVAAPALSMTVFRAYRARWPQGPWPSLEAACQLACADDPDRARGLARAVRDSALAHWGVITLMPRVAGRTAVRVAPDVLRALAGRTPLFPTVLKGAATLMPLGVGWGAAAQAELAGALNALRTGAARCVHVIAEAHAGVLDAMAVDRPTLAIDTAALAPVLVEPLRVAARVARLRRLWLLVRATRQTWPLVERWARTAAGPVVIEAPSPCLMRPADDVQTVTAEVLDAGARHAIWRAETDPVVAARLAQGYQLGRAAIRATVDAVRLRADPLTTRCIEAELARRGHRLVV